MLIIPVPKKQIPWALPENPKMMFFFIIVVVSSFIASSDEEDMRQYLERNWNYTWSHKIVL